MGRKMRILLISYEDYEYDGRLRSLIKAFSSIGDLTCFLGGGSNKEWITTCNAKYPVFIKKVFSFARQYGTIDMLILDNRKATIPGLLIRRWLKPGVIVQDCRELYRLKETPNLAGKIGCIFERKMMKKADIVIAANEERAEIMQQENQLDRKPLVYENLRELQYGSENEKEKAKEKIGKLINDDCINIVSSSGCEVLRTNDVLARNLKKIGRKCRLFLVGSNWEEDEKIIKAIAAEDKENEIIILGLLNQTELKYLLSRCDIGIVNYGQFDTNNKYCASGKLYEFIYEGVPVVTTTNPPLKNCCEKYGIGVADDEYYHGIQEIMANYSTYKANTIEFAKAHTVEDNDARLIKEVQKILATL